MDRLFIQKLIDSSYNIAESESNCNGYVSKHEIFTEEVFNTTKFKVLNTDNQGAKWEDYYEFVGSDKCIMFTAANMDYNIQFGMQSPIEGLKDFAVYIFKSIFKDNTNLKQMSDKLIEPYLNLKNLDKLIKYYKDLAENAYDKYMYEEAAEIGYDAKASSNAFSDYSKYTKYAESLNKIKTELTTKGE